MKYIRLLVDILPALSVIGWIVKVHLCDHWDEGTTFFVLFSIGFLLCYYVYVVTVRTIFKFVTKKHWAIEVLYACLILFPCGWLYFGRGLITLSSYIAS